MGIFLWDLETYRKSLKNYVFTEALSALDKSSNGISPGAENPDLNFSITILES